ncbi:Aminotransferase, class I/classII domain-containing protein [Rozella allomycis CSF55]|uniref:Alanine aminotransferase 1 n=1 Tax=Rozella allomycis (strain CSF55) TaxID=988480 RepID=A0A075AQR3_ROZAC|nr:Aminotransferase, class I/classII domain-containing protein [Rozella allomycis CSF55]|eukprot:EPZ32571.1 Aminotransferase, class I/classII domain-containing protein [Rozella allomycis CSF55]
MTLTHSNKVLQLRNINSKILQTQYAVRGEIAIRAEQLRKELESNPQSFPFKKIINCNIGNPQQLNQKPITFFRQIMSLLEYPELFKNTEYLDKIKYIYPNDVINRAQQILRQSGPIGAYSHSKGIPYVRNAVAKYIHERDGYESNPEHIFLTNGASPAVQMILSVIIQHLDVGVLIPIPQYPLYSASLALLGGKPVPYYLDEKTNWGLDIKDAIRTHKEQGIDVRAMCIINPGNPTGNCLTGDQIEQVINLCHEERIVLLADEVYQTNVYSGKSFISAKKVLRS